MKLKYLFLFLSSLTALSQEVITELPRDKSITNGISIKLDLTDEVYCKLLCIRSFLNETNISANNWIRNNGINYVKIVLTPEANETFEKQKLDVSIWIKSLGANEEDEQILKRILAIKNKK